ncbi:MAG: two-component sensor histidine kinase [Rhodobacteraceae bacterium]|nr:two-component sensor histidine kinase [Paracoccaceae bacterium]
MVLRLIQRLMPRGLFGRAVMILIAPVVVIQLVVSVVFFQRHFEGVTRQMTRSVVAELATLLAAVEAAPDAAAARAAVAPLLAPLAIAMTLPAADPPADDRRPFHDLSGLTVIATLREGLAGVGAVDLATDDARVIVVLATRHGPMTLAVARRRVSASNPHQLLVLMVGSGLLLTGIAYLFLRNQIRPIARLAAAAEAFGKGRSLAFRPSGATEVRAAGAAFLDMRARIERHIEQRTLLLSGVSHDLRTPLTRMRLGLAMLPEGAEAAALGQDIDEMERLIASFLDFARGAGPEAPVAADPAALVAGVVERARRAGQPVTLGPIAGAGPVMLRVQAVTRAVENLVGNGVRHGRRVEVGLRVNAREVTISVDDDGPGIPPARREEALRPFSRLDPARNQDRGGGVGLGLAIAADIARSHGGTLRLAESPTLGGLRAELVLAR